MKILCRFLIGVAIADAAALPPPLPRKSGTTSAPIRTSHV